MAERIDIERALDELVSNEGGMIFQGLAVVLAKIRYPELVACERKNDLGLDAYASVALSPDGRGKGVACSTTGTFSKINSDAKEGRVGAEAPRCVRWRAGQNRPGDLRIRRRERDFPGTSNPP